MTPTAPVSESTAPPGHPAQVQHTRCCVVGGGPAGAVLALLLARQGVEVTLLESHKDFDRDFRGDTLHPSVLEVMDELGLADRLLTLRHSRMRQVQFLAGNAGPVRINLEHLHTRFPFIVMMPQVDFLDFIVAEAQRYPGFKLAMGARVESLVEEGGQVRGVRYHAEDGVHEVRAELVVGADGRFSKVRMLAGIELHKLTAPIDVLWFRLPRMEGDPEGLQGNIRNGHIALMLERPADWQVAYVIAKGGWQQVRAEGLEALQQGLVRVLPLLGDRVRHLQSWKQVSVLSVEAGRVKRWYKPGLLLIGDAAHTMSPVGGVGINYAIMDAVECSNVLGRPLREGRVTEAHLAQVQRRREWPTRVIQAFQALAQRRVLRAGLEQKEGDFRLPLFMRLGWVRRRVAHLVAFGVRPAHVQAG